MTGRQTKFRTIVEAAECLGMSKRHLLDWLSANPLDQAGQPFCIGSNRSRLFSDHDLDRIEAARREQTRRALVERIEKLTPPTRRAKTRDRRALSTSSQPTPESLLAEAHELISQASPRRATR